MNKLGIFVKQPAAGRVKTRLAQDIGAAAAADIYASFIEDIAHRHRVTADQRWLCYAPPEGEPAFQRLAGHDYRLWAQPEADLGARLQAFFQQHLGTADRVIVIGSDSPTLPAEIVERGFELLAAADCVIGPATDGGYYLVGMRGRALPIFDGIAWSSAAVLEQTIARIEELGAQLAVLPVWYDVDTLNDLRMLRGHVRALRRAQSPLNLDAVAASLELLREGDL